MSKSTNGLKCPRCGSNNIIKSGTRKLATKVDKIQQYYCNDCGGNTRYPSRIISTEKAATNWL